MSPAWFRRVRPLMKRAGYDAVRVAPSTFLLGRGGDVELRRLAPDAVLAARRPRRPRRGAAQWLAAEKELAHYLVGRHVAAVLEMYRVNCVVDVGANRGQYGQALRRAGYTGHIASFEPVAEPFAKLARAAGDDPRWEVHRCALGREDGTATMNVVPGTLSSVLAPTRFGAGRYAKLREAEEQEVPVRRLDGLLDDILRSVDAPRPFLKLDTQGYDLEAFAGLGDRAREFVGLQSEVALMRIYEGMPRLPEALATYEAAGFGVTGLFPVSRQSRTGRVLEFDCVMVRPDAV